MPYCSVASCVKSCYSTVLNKDRISFHRFPKDLKRRDAWIKACSLERWSITEESLICSTHFEDHCYKPGRTKCKLFDWAVPTLHLDGPSLSRKRKAYTKKKEIRNYLSDDDDDLDNEVTQYDDQENSIVEEKAILEKRLKVLSTNQNHQNCESHSEQSEESSPDYEQYTFTTKRDVDNVEDILNALEEKFRMPLEDLDCLKYTGVKKRDLVAHAAKRKFSSNLRSFALTLYYFSPKAYIFIRKRFNTCLPHTLRLKNWYFSRDGAPGFTKEALDVLKHKANSTDYPIVATLIVGEMNLRRYVHVYKGKIEGYIDVGTGLDGDYLAEASEVLVFLVSAINSNFKIPVAYFLIEKISSSQRAELVKLCLENIQKTGITIVALSSKGNSSDVVMAEELGCSLKDRIVKFNHPMNCTVINLWDPCNMADLLRSAFRRYKIFIDENGNKLEWRYYEELEKIIKKDNLDYNLHYTLGPSINFTMNTLKEKLIHHPFSLTVAEAMKYFRNDSKLEAFSNNEPTEIFIILINNIIDVFDSISLYHRGLRSNLKENDIVGIMQFIEGATTYISGLKCEDGTLLIRSSYKTAFLGLLGNLDGLKYLLQLLTQPKDRLPNLPLHKMNQKQLNLFFSNIKVTCGSEEPTTVRFKEAYKCFIRELKENTNGTLVTNFCFSNCKLAIDRINETTISVEVDTDIEKGYEFDDAVKGLYTSYLVTSEYYDEAFTYIVTFVTRYLTTKILCEICNEALVTEGTNKILYPSPDVIAICKTTELMLKIYEEKNIKTKRPFQKHAEKIKKEVIVAKILLQFVGTSIFDRINYHQLGVFPTSNHVTDLMKAVIEGYITFRVIETVDEPYNCRLQLF